ncbi:S-layer homology domain-containing protein, partial [Ellagibacter isourolithinifaciens]|uniref:S-layer homology domain-containing protein n=1 Tax=Ellagibacter isourolithinifaciens TaxID=2137581 RepID=UPI002E79FF08
PFSDADPNAYYYNALCWAKEIGVSTGYSGTDSFGPNDPVTREQLATLFARYASVVDGRDTSSDCSAMNSKNGADEVSDYAREAMGWAVDTGLIAGVNGTDLEPGGTAWRASMAEMVKRYSSF